MWWMLHIVFDSQMELNLQVQLNSTMKKENAKLTHATKVRLVTILSHVNTSKKEEIHTKLTHEADVACGGCYVSVVYLFLVEFSCICKLSSLCEFSYMPSSPHKQPLHHVSLVCVIRPS